MYTWAVDSIKEALHSNQFLQGGLVLGIITAVLVYLKNIPIQLYNFSKKFIYFELVISQSDDVRLFTYFDKWYTNKYPAKYRKVTAQFTDNHQGLSKTVNRITQDNTNRPDEWDLSDRCNIAIKQRNDINYIWHGGRLLIIENTEHHLEGAMNPTDSHYASYTISGFFAKKCILNLLAELRSMRIENEIKTKGISVTTFNASGYGSKRILRTYKTFDHIYFNGKSDLIKYIDNFTNTKERCSKNGIKHKTGIKLHGPPGTGKTSVAVALADYLNYNIALVNILSLSSDEALLEIIEDIQNNTIILFEDADDAIGAPTTKSKTKKEGAVTFSTILQVLDGIQSPENVIFMLTTNHPTSLDSALYRDGRINKIVEIGYPRYTDIIDFINSYYDLQLSLADVFPKVDGDTCIKTGMSTIEQYCLESYDIDTLLTRLKKEKI